MLFHVLAVNRHPGVVTAGGIDMYSEQVTKIFPDILGVLSNEAKSIPRKTQVITY
jgi:hypothetical protein